MGNPRRFIGTGKEVQVGDFVMPARTPVEVTFRTLQQRFQLRPDQEATDIILGCLGRALDRHPGVNLAVISVLSNHGCFVAMPESAARLSSFMRDFLSTTARRLNRHRKRDGVFWERRYRAIPILDEQALEDRFRYVLTQGTKENLVWSARDWPGVSSVQPLLGGKPLEGRWRDHAREAALNRERSRKLERAQRRKRQRSLPAVAQQWLRYPIHLVPLPHWRSLKPGQRRARVAAMLKHDDEQTRARHKRDRTEPLDVARILATKPSARPAVSKSSPAPDCHATAPAHRRAFRAIYKSFLEALASCTDAAIRMLDSLKLPQGAALAPLTRPLRKDTSMNVHAKRHGTRGSPGP